MSEFMHPLIRLSTMSDQNLSLVLNAPLAQIRRVQELSDSVNRKLTLLVSPMGVMAVRISLTRFQSALMQRLHQCPPELHSTVSLVSLLRLSLLWCWRNCWRCFHFNHAYTCCGHLCACMSRKRFTNTFFIRVLVPKMFPQLYSENTSNAHTKCVGTICFNFIFYVYFMVCLRMIRVH
jgi:hypothetical protein